MLEFKTYFQNKRNLAGLIVLLILILAIPLGIYLARNTQIFAPKADVIGSIALAEGNCVTILNGEKVLICKDVPLRLISPFNKPSPSASPSSSASSASSPSPSPSATASRSPSPGTGEKTLVLVTDSFNPSKIQIKLGTIVTWKNDSNRAQNLTSGKKLFPAQTLEPGKEFSFKFISKGTFRFENKLSRKKSEIKVIE